MGQIFEFTLTVPVKHDRDPADEKKYTASYPAWTPELVARIQPYIREPLKVEDPPGSWKTLTGDAFRLVGLLTGSGVEVSIKGGGEVGVTALEAVLQRIDAIAERQNASGPVLNSRVNVAVPGLGLLLMNELHVEYNVCTDVLQKALNDGWRILAICPQPDQRRPDYILGRNNPAREV